MLWKEIGMDDKDIIELLLIRSESALEALKNKYSKYCFTIASNILGNAEDVEEVINDTFHHMWNAIPPNQPESLRAFIGSIARNLSLDRFEKAKAQKRGGGQISIILSELDDCIPDNKNSIDELIEIESLTSVLNTFLSDQKIENRHIFIRRYWYAASLEEIADDLNKTVGNIKVILYRMRNKLKKYLESEGIFL
jgi:RNA polymerase sigma-70 factor (ECF subfamily)